MDTLPACHGDECSDSAGGYGGVWDVSCVLETNEGGRGDEKGGVRRRGKGKRKCGVREKKRGGGEMVV